MTIAEKLFEIGVKCQACGRTVTCTSRLHNRFQMVCHCGATGGFPLEVGMRAALTSWLVLTGGPIPAAVPPPEGGYHLYTGRGKDGGYLEGFADGGEIAEYYLPPYQRTHTIILEWLESEI